MAPPSGFIKKYFTSNSVKRWGATQLVTKCVESVEKHNARQLPYIHTKYLCSRHIVWIGYRRTIMQIDARRNLGYMPVVGGELSAITSLYHIGVSRSVNNLNYGVQNARPSTE